MIYTVAIACDISDIRNIVNHCTAWLDDRSRAMLYVVIDDNWHIAVFNQSPQSRWRKIVFNIDTAAEVPDELHEPWMPLAPALTEQDIMALATEVTKLDGIFEYREDGLKLG